MFIVVLDRGEGRTVVVYGKEKTCKHKGEYRNKSTWCRRERELTNRTPPCCDRIATEHTTSTRSGRKYVEKRLENKPHFRTHTHYRFVFPQNTPCPTTTRLRSSSATQIPPALQTARRTVFSPGTPSNFHLNFIPGSLDEIHFSLGKPRNCVEFARFKKERKKKGVETRE